jgi:hypothetical protein
MRGLAAATALLAAAAAHADDVRNVPAVGTTLTYRMVSTSRLQTTTVTVGQIYTYVVTASDGVTAEGIIKPVAMIYGCPQGDTRKECVEASKAPNMRREGDLIVIPIPADITENLAKQSRFRYRSFVLEQRKAAIPGPKNPDAPDASEIGPNPAFVLTNSMECDRTALQAFVPLGVMMKTSLPCKMTMTRTPGADSKVPAANASDAVTMEVSLGDIGRITVPSGTWDVRKLTIKVVPSDAKHPGFEGDTEFALKLGIGVKTHIVSNNPAGAAVVQSDSELIAVSQ